jgi:iron complex outermembrane receptor protein
VNGNQPNRGLSVDTRGTPVATTFAANIERSLRAERLAARRYHAMYLRDGTLQEPASLTLGTLAERPRLLHPGHDRRGYRWHQHRSTCRAAQAATRSTAAWPMTSALWVTTSARNMPVRGTRAAPVVLQQPLQTLDLLWPRQPWRIAARTSSSFEVTGSDADSAKRFSNNAAILGNTTTLPLAYPLNAADDRRTYDSGVRLRSRSAFDVAIGAVGDPHRADRRAQRTLRPADLLSLALHLPAASASINTSTSTFRAAGGAEGPLFDRVGLPRRRVLCAAARAHFGARLRLLLSRHLFIRGCGSGYRSFQRAVRAASIRRRADRAGQPARRGLVGVLNSRHDQPVQRWCRPRPALAALEAASADGADAVWRQI